MIAHVVVIALPVHGHLNPLLQLSLKLASMGIAVSFITTHSSTVEAIPGLLDSILEDDMQQALLRNLRMFTIVDSEEVDQLRLEGERGILANILFMQRKAGEVDELVEQAVQEQGPVCHFIVDLLVVRVLGENLSKRRVPKAIFCTASAPFMLVTVHLRKLVQGGYVPVAADNEGQTVMIPGIPELNVAADLPYGIQEQLPYDPDYRLKSMVRENALAASFVLLNTFHELEADAISSLQQEGVNVVTVGPLLPINPKPASSKFSSIFSWLDTKPAASVVFICFGSMKAMSNSQQIEELAYGLESSKHTFLWILRDGLKSLLPDGFEKRVHGQGLIVPWCPQLQVLRHPSIGAFFTHCGWNSILESITSGVPMLGWPCMAEQNLNCKYLADVWKVGYRVHTQPKRQKHPVADRSRIQALVQSVMGPEGDQMRKRAAEWRDAARNAVKIHGSSTRNLKELVQVIAGAKVLHPTLKSGNLQKA